MSSRRIGLIAFRISIITIRLLKGEWPLKHWMGEDARQTVAAGGHQAFFGFEQIEAREKSARVLRHFNSVAHVYDFMNTLLSFGIHHAWKRAAVRMLRLAPGDRVLDVCGGTGDLALLAALFAYRFRSGAWRSIELIEPKLVD